MLKTLLVDDETPAREELRFLFQEIGGVSVVGECASGDEALEFIKTNAVDVVILDIQMHGKDGLTTAWEILQQVNVPKLIFATGFSDYAVQAFELNAVDYVMKPYSKKRLEQTVEKLRHLKRDESLNKSLVEMLMKNNQQQPMRLPVWANDRLILLNPAEIFYAKAEAKRKTLLAAREGSYHTSLTLREVEDKLGDANFFRTHKSYLVNLAKIKEIVPWFNNTYMLVLEGCPDANIPVGGHFVKDFNHRIGI